MKNLLKTSLGIVLMGVLTFCSYGCKSNIEIHTHTFNEEWSTNATYHWHKSTCEHEIVNKEKHIFKEWSPSEIATLDREEIIPLACEICGYHTGRMEIIHGEYGNKIVTEYNNNGKKIKCTEYTSDGSIFSIEEYDSKGAIFKYTQYDSDGYINHIIEYDGNERSRFTEYYFDGSWSVMDFYNNGIIHTLTKDIRYSPNGTVIFSVIFDYECDSNGKIVKFTAYNYDGSVLIEYQTTIGDCICFWTNIGDQSIYVEEYDSSNTKVKYTQYNNNGSIIIQYQPLNNNYFEVKCTKDRKISYIVEFTIDNDIYHLVKCTAYNNKDGSLLIEYHATNDNYIVIWEDSNYYVSDIWEFTSNHDLIKKTIYNTDGTIKEVIRF